MVFQITAGYGAVLALLMIVLAVQVMAGIAMLIPSIAILIIQFAG